MCEFRRFIRRMHSVHLHLIAFFLTLFLFKIAAALIDDSVFLIFIGQNRTDKHKMHVGDDFRTLKLTHFYNNAKPTAVYIHGWQGRFERRASQGIIDAYLTRADHNFIFVDWSKNARQWNYAKTALAMNETTEKITNLILEMRRANYDLRKFHFIGYSFGAHYAGQIGESLKSRNIWLERITGLDPAGPMFYQQQNLENSSLSAFGLTSLRSGNAKFVDIIHSDAGFFGTSDSTADMDFWPNGGRKVQPGCDFKTCYATSMDPCLLCSHDRSWKFYAESVRSEKKTVFLSKLCEKSAKEFNRTTCKGTLRASMGFYANLTPKKFHGNYYTETRKIAPYSAS